MSGPFTSPVLSPVLQTSLRRTSPSRCTPSFPDGHGADALGSYNPDWAVLIDSEEGERLYFVVETKAAWFPTIFAAPKAPRSSVARRTSTRSKWGSRQPGTSWRPTATSYWRALVRTDRLCRSLPRGLFHLLVFCGQEVCAQGGYEGTFLSTDWSRGKSV